jgi:hypothetical protein
MSTAPRPRRKVASARARADGRRPTADEVGCLSDDQCRYDEAEVGSGQNGTATGVILVVGIGGRVQGARVNDGEHPRPTRARAAPHIAAGRSLAAAPDGGKRQLALLIGAADAEIVAQRISGDRGCWQRAPARLALEGVGEREPIVLAVAADHPLAARSRVGSRARRSVERVALQLSSI